ncbi:premnaspirodiene oxygenase-like isoform X1 [Coffea eugenioides]|uniref:premnaspirodiene oxygenase-like isoform X1 n=1 Tax=Coffea eugenioides TaxID=49369 RepID=UPI000F60CEE4|nr:premnaspirodiene oxygenase-like isoform X1 [Coffea eugenioides]XP_027182999.1 premnaspirodiene oxygenase-like isoform X1 [Coffea eugenioides]
MELPFNFIAFFLFLAFVLCLIKEWKRSKAAQKFPPSPLKLPVIGNMHHLVGSPPHHALRKLARQHGALMHLQLGEISSIVVSSPHLAKEIMKTHDLAFADRAEFLTSKILMYNSSDIACCPYGDYWRQMRKICTLELLSAKNVRSFGSIRQDEASHLVASVQALAAAGKLVNISEKLYSYTSSMVCRAAFGKVSKDLHREFLQLTSESAPLSSTFDISDLFPSFKILHPLLSVKSQLVKIHLKMDKLLGNIIDQHIDNLARTNMATGESGNEDLIDVLLRVKESGDLQFPIANNNIKAIVIDVFSAGTETSSTTVEWAMSEMVRNPNVMAKAQSEIRTAFKGKKKIEETDIQELKYLKLVIKETLRLHPPVPLLVPRECREECEIEGYTIPVKTRVLVNAWAIGRDPEYWDDPESFKPDRFKTNPVDFTGTHFEYLPFGAGRRMCPGISFGLANVDLPLALLLYHFNWKLPNGLDPCDLDMSETVGITASRKDSLRLLATSYDP